MHTFHNRPRDIFSNYSMKVDIEKLRKHNLSIIVAIFSIGFLVLFILQSTAVLDRNNSNRDELVQPTKTFIKDPNQSYFLLRVGNKQEQQWAENMLLLNSTYYCNAHHVVKLITDPNAYYDIEIYFNSTHIQNGSVPHSAPAPSVPRVLYNDPSVPRVQSACTKKMNCNEDYNFIVSPYPESTLKVGSPLANRVQSFLDAPQFQYDYEIGPPKTLFFHMLIENYHYRHIKPTIASFFQPLGRSLDSSAGDSSDSSNETGSNYSTTCTKETSDMLVELQRYIVFHSYGNCSNTSLPFQESSPYQLAEKEQYIVGFNIARTKDIIRKYKYHLITDPHNCCSTAFEWDQMVDRIILVLESGSVPVILSKRKTFTDVLPYGSYVHLADFHSIHHMAKYLISSEQNDPKYKSFFDWRKNTTAMEQWKTRLENQRWLGQLVNVLNFWNKNRLNSPSNNNREDNDW
ncbi:hypothetical protein CYY_001534 [Polysphondylium violaceum]|uniref:Fucosyltransferase n=1 Tax=Polysphondylium violaceum TaxID=133409 RepID=A0A8J4Q1M9_9MYCE|nr:hypothetical protein CYY_001534 [Polysphondylium violaceum]